MPSGMAGKSRKRLLLNSVLSDSASHMDNNHGMRHYTRCFFFAILIGLLPHCVMFHFGIVGRDSGVFIYTGQVLIDGGMPYIGSWDHKGPLLYLLNAFALFLFDDYASVALLEGMALSVGIFVSLIFWSRVIGTKDVLSTGTVFAFLYYTTFQGGNLTETWLVPLLLVAYSALIVFFYSTDELQRKSMASAAFYLLCLATSVAILTRPNNAIGPTVSAALLLFAYPSVFKRLVFRGLVLLLLPMFAALVWLHEQHALVAMIDQYWRYNSLYSAGEPAVSRLYALGILLISALVFPYSEQIFRTLLKTIRMRYTDSEKSNLIPYLILVGTLIAFLASQSVSGKAYIHYASICIPIITAVFVSTRKIELNIPNSRNRSVLPFFTYMTVILCCMKLGYAAYQSYSNSTRRVDSNNKLLIDLVSSRYQHLDSIATFGADTWILVASGKRSLTPVTYNYPVLSNYQNLASEYLAFLKSKRPLLIIESPTAFVNPFRNEVKAPFETHMIKEELQSKYRLDTVLNGYRFWIPR